MIVKNATKMGGHRTRRREKVSENHPNSKISDFVTVYGPSVC